MDTERGTDFYAQPVNEREAHPEAFDFDALCTRSLRIYNRSILNEERAPALMFLAELGPLVETEKSLIWQKLRQSFHASREFVF